MNNNTYQNTSSITIKQHDCHYLYPQIGFGGEGFVYQYNEELAFKTFDFTEDKSTLTNKFKKISLLMQLNDPSFCFPKGLVTDETGATIGYYTNLVTPSKKCKDFSYLTFLKDKKAILNYILKAESSFKRAHSIGLIIGDIRGENIMIDNQENPRFVDTDNFAYQDFDFDISDERTKWLQMAFQKPCTPLNNDIYVFALLTLQLFIEGTSLTRFQSAIYFKHLIHYLNIPSSMKEGLHQIFSDSPNKPYIGDILKNISFDEELITKKHVKRLNRLY